MIARLYRCGRFGKVGAAVRRKKHRAGVSPGRGPPVWKTLYLWNMPVWQNAAPPREQGRHAELAWYTEFAGLDTKQCRELTSENDMGPAPIAVISVVNESTGCISAPVTGSV